MWIVAGAALAYLIVWFVKNRGLLSGYPEQRRSEHLSTLTLVGLDIRPETLPKVVETEARHYFSRGDARTALSLLYRGALSALVHKERLQIPASATEEECLQMARQLQQPAAYAYLQWLTQVWQEMAYAHHPPDPAEAERLCQGWGGVYGE
jgi:hypothetical protein